MNETTATLLQEIAENTPKVYAAGVEAGKKEGKQEQYDAFWNDFQENGDRGEYTYAFFRWNEKTFKPKYDIRPTGGSASILRSVTGIYDLEKYLEDLGVVLDFSQSTGSTDTFLNSSFTVIGVVDFSNIGNLGYTFQYCYDLHTIRKLVMPKKKVTYSNVFKDCRSLQNIVIEGEIKNSLSFSESPLLSKASIESVMSHLSQTEALTITFSQTAVNNAFTTAEWQAIINNKPANVTVSLV